MYGLPKIESNEWWKKLIFSIIGVLTVIAYAYQIMFCVWIIFWTPLQIWRIESLVLIFLSLFFILTEVMAIILSCSGVTGTSGWCKCCMTNYIVWLSLLILCTVFTLIMALISEEQIADQYMFGILYSLANFIVMLLSALLYYCFFFKSTTTPYYLLPSQAWSLPPNYLY